MSSSNNPLRSFSCRGGLISAMLLSKPLQRGLLKRGRSQSALQSLGVGAGCLLASGGHLYQRLCNNVTIRTEEFLIVIIQIHFESISDEMTVWCDKVYSGRDSLCPLSYYLGNKITSLKVSGAFGVWIQPLAFPSGVNGDQNTAERRLMLHLI